MWKTLKLEEIVDISIGKTPSRGNPKFWDQEKITKNIWISIADLTSSQGLFIDDSKEYISDEGAKLFKSVPSETLVMSFKLSIGKLAITKCELRTNEAIAAFRIKDEKIVSQKYLFYFLSSIDWVTLAGRDIKVKGMTLNKAKLKQIPISLPSIEKQKSIVEKLDDTFSEINQLNSTKKEVFQQKKKLEENFYKVIFKSLEDEYGLMKLEDGIELVSGQHIIAKDYNSNGDGIGYLTGPADFGSVSPVVSKFTLKPKKTAIKNDILITVKGSGIGKVNIMDQNELAISRQLAAIRPIKFDPSYLFIFLKTKFDFFQKLGNGAAIPGLSRTDVQKLEVPKVPIVNQHELVDKLHKFQILISEYQTLQNLKYQELNSLRSAILSKELQAKTV